MRKWEKILYRQQPFPDNYSGGQEQFLRELRKNVSAVQYKYFDAVVACCNFTFHVNSVILLFLVYEKVQSGFLHEEALLLSCFVSFIILYAIYSFLLTEVTVNFTDHFFTIVTLIFYGFGLTPIIRTLTTTISTDTIYATSIFAGIISCIFHDYGVKAPIVSMPFSASSGLCSVIFLLSRVESNSSAFALLSLAFAIHACSPEFSLLMDYKGGSEPLAKRPRANYVDIETPPEFYETSETPSKVIHITELSSKAQDPDLLETFGRFGRVSYTVIKRHPKNMALVEYEAIDGGSSVILFAQTSPIEVCSQTVNVHFSALDKIPRFGFETDQSNKVLVLLITNVQFNINAHTLYDICKPHGTVLRIAIVKRTPNVTALVEFESTEMARTCKFGINGADIYTNCCTLKVEFAKIANVRIVFPDDDHVDFTQHFPSEAQRNRRPLMGSPPNDPYTPAYINSGQVPPPPPASDYPGYSAAYAPPRYAHGTRDSYYDSRREPQAMYGDYGGGYMFPRSNNYSARGDPWDIRQTSLSRHNSYIDLMRGGPGCVLIIGGVDQTKLNCDRLFNLLCIYGNVLRVMFMKKKSELALVEMGTSWQAREAIQNLRTVDFLGMNIEVSLSNQQCINAMQNPFTLPDGTISYKDYSTGKLNRYMTRDHAEKNRPCPPQSSLHWFNAPPEMEEEQVRSIFRDYGAPDPKSVRVHRLQSGRSTAGTAEFNSILEATEALVLSNHATLETVSTATPFFVKMAFTKVRGHRGSDGNEPFALGRPNARPPRSGVWQREL